jgi:glycosyltransferase involved in cell wall biosynthesis
VGGTAQRKGIIRLVEAYQQLDQELKHAYDLVIVGRFNPAIGYQAATLAAIASERVGRIVNIPAVSNEILGDVYRGASVFVFPSFSEGFGLPPLEAMSCGVPVIASNRTSIPEVVGDAAVMIDPDDLNSIVIALTEILSSSSLRAELSARSLRRSKLYSWHTTATLTLKAYEDAVNG